MRRDIIQFILRMCEKTGFPLSLNYYPANHQGDRHDIYSVHLRGRSVVNFTSKNFYSIPLSEREKHFSPLIRIGMAHNLGEESLKDQIEIPRRQGINIIRDAKLIYGR